MWIKAAVGFGIAAALAIGGWQLTQAIGDHFATHERNKVRITELEGEIGQVRGELAAERLANKLDGQDDLEAYEKADWACQETVKRVVAATKIVPVPVKEYVHVEKQVTVPGECPGYRFPDLYRVRVVNKGLRQMNLSVIATLRVSTDRCGTPFSKPLFSFAALFVPHLR